MKAPILILFPVVAGLLVSSCGTSDPALTYQNEVIGRETEARSAVFPRVTSPGWRVLGDGKPELDVTGYSRVSWVKTGSPKDVVEVFYHGKMNPRIETNDPSTVTVMGHTVQTYPSGNEDPAFATQPVRLTAPNGTSAYYSFQFNNDHLCKTRNIPQFGW